MARELTDEECDAIGIEAERVARDALKWGEGIGTSGSGALTMLGEAYAAAIVSCMGPNPSMEQIVFAIGHAVNSVATNIQAHIAERRGTMQ